MSKKKNRTNDLLGQVNQKANQLLKEIIITRKNQTNDEVLLEIDRLMQHTNFIYQEIPI